ARPGPRGDRDARPTSDARARGRARQPDSERAPGRARVRPLPADARAGSIRATRARIPQLSNAAAPRKPARLVVLAEEPKDDEAHSCRVLAERRRRSYGAFARTENTFALSPSVVAKKATRSSPAAASP